MTDQTTTRRAGHRKARPHSLVALIGVVAAALVASALGTAGAAVAVTTAPAATSIAIRVLQQDVAPGQTGTVVGNLQVRGGSPAGRPLALEAQAVGEATFTPVGTATTGVKGDVRISVRPAVTTHYRWRYAGADDARSRVSGVAVVRVRTGEHPAHRLSTSLSIRALRAAVAPGGSDIIRGTLVSGNRQLRGRYVVLLARAEGQSSWQFRKVQRTGRQGGVNFTVRPQVRTDYKLAFAGTGIFQPARSGVVSVGVRPAVTIAVAPTAVDPGESTVVTGTVARTGSPVAGATVDLLARAVGARTAWAVAGTGTTAADGSVSITATPGGDTRYRLRARLCGRAADRLEPRGRGRSTGPQLALDPRPGRRRRPRHHRSAPSAGSGGDAALWSRCRPSTRSPRAGRPRPRPAPPATAECGSSDRVRPAPTTVSCTRASGSPAARAQRSPISPLTTSLGGMALDATNDRHLPRGLGTTTSRVRAAVAVVEDQVQDEMETALVAAREGDEAGFATLWRDLHPRLLRYLRVRGDEASEDLAAETWMHVVRGLPTFEGGVPEFRAWLFTIARHRAIDQGRARTRGLALVSVADPVDVVGGVPTVQSAEQEAVDNEGTAEALRLVATLPPAQAEMVMLRVVAGLDVADVAQLLGKRPGAVRVGVHRALKTLSRTAGPDSEGGER